MKLLRWKYHPKVIDGNYVSICNLGIHALIDEMAQLKWTGSGVDLSNQVLSKVLRLTV